MCVIIIREPGVTIPMDKLTLACNINKDGHGLAWVNRKRLRRDISIEPNNPDDIQKKLEGLKDFRVFLHLRHATVGEVNILNAHPFTVLEHKLDGVDLGFMHNGTLYPWSPSYNDNPDKISDSRNFAEGLVAPLAMRSRAFVNTSPLRDNFFLQSINRELKHQQSTLLFFDNHGNVQIFNETPWKEFEGWKASNDYSFNENHTRNRPAQNYTYKGWEREYDNDYVPFGERRGTSKTEDVFKKIPVLEVGPDQKAWASDWEAALKQLDEQEKESQELSTLVRQAKQIPYEILQQQLNTVKQHVTTAIMDQPETSMKALQQMYVKRPSFVQEMEMNDILDLGNLTEENFIALCRTCPVAMAQAFIDLTAELRRVRADNTSLRKTETSNG